MASGLGLVSIPPRHMRSPGDDGYRTPTIEDAERTISILGATDTPRAIARDVHASALEETLQKISSRAPTDPRSKRESSDWEPRGRHLDRTFTDASADRLSWKKRIRHITWAYFTLTMATGGIANVLYEGKVKNPPDALHLLMKPTVPYRFRGLETIGVIVFLFNIFLYLLIWALLLARFYFYPYTFKASFLHPTESLFIPASMVSFGTILINISQYGPGRAGPWLLEAVGILFWIDCILAVLFSAGIYLIL